MTDGQLEARITKLEGHAMALARLLEAQQDVSRNLTQAIAVLGHTIGETADGLGGRIESLNDRITSMALLAAAGKEDEG
ncbi:MAG TPA: hypothetical protein DCQ64_01490 [Candidatus Rokubacteria bacterium]|nr:hypothetical protein [Candidatus Rokubacteria bacterium]